MADMNNVLHIVRQHDSDIRKLRARLSEEQIDAEKLQTRLKDSHLCIKNLTLEIEELDRAKKEAIDAAKESFDSWIQDSLDKFDPESEAYVAQEKKRKGEGKFKGPVESIIGRIKRG